MSYEFRIDISKSVRVGSRGDVTDEQIAEALRQKSNSRIEASRLIGISEYYVYRYCRDHHVPAIWRHMSKEALIVESLTRHNGDRHAVVRETGANIRTVEKHARTNGFAVREKKTYVRKPMSQCIRWNNEKIARLREMYLDGATSEQMAAVFGGTVKAIHTTLSRKGISRFQANGGEYRNQLLDGQTNKNAETASAASARSSPSASATANAHAAGRSIPQCPLKHKTKQEINMAFKSLNQLGFPKRKPKPAVINPFGTDVPSGIVDETDERGALDSRSLTQAEIDAISTLGAEERVYSEPIDETIDEMPPEPEPLSGRPVSYRPPARDIDCRPGDVPVRPPSRVAAPPDKRPRPSFFIHQKPLYTRSLPATPEPVLVKTHCAPPPPPPSARVQSGIGQVSSPLAPAFVRPSAPPRPKLPPGLPGGVGKLSRYPVAAIVRPPKVPDELIGKPLKPDDIPF